MAQKINNLDNGYEREFHSVVESDFKKSKIYINKITNILNSIKKIYSLSKIKEHLIKNRESGLKTDSEKKTNNSAEIPDMPDI